MEPEMNAPDNHSLLMNHLLELEETAALEQVKIRLSAGEDPFEIIEDAQQALRLVGERYEQGEYFISSMMLAGEIFREVMEIVEPVLILRKTEDESRSVLLGTVEGDIHDIGKNIFAVMLRCHGFEVIDLGVDVSPEKFASEAARTAPDIIALSGLLTISYESMKETVRKIKELGDSTVAQTPIMIGGGFVSATVCAQVGADYWATDAMVGVKLCRQLV
jgi:methanogenic corrinoid protein MtbC1